MVVIVSRHVAVIKNTNARRYQTTVQKSTDQYLSAAMVFTNCLPTLTF